MSSDLIYDDKGRSRLAKGHTLSRTHGAWSASKVDPVAEQLVELAVESAPWLADGLYGPAVLAWARAEARCQVLADWLDEHGLLDDEGRPRPAAEAATRLEKLALTHRQRLGLDPTARAGLEATLTSAKAGQLALAEALRRGGEVLSARAGGSEASTEVHGGASGTAEQSPRPSASPQSLGEPTELHRTSGPTGEERGR